MISIPSHNLYEKNIDGKFIYIRHGETQYNHNSKTIAKKIIKVDPQYLDSHLSQKGINQAKHLQSEINKLDIEQIYVSPLFRALETVTLMLENHPKIKEIIVKVHPLITETVSGVHDFPKSIQKTKEKFNMNSKVKIDWILFDSLFTDEKHQELFFIDYIDQLNEKCKSEIISKIEKAYQENKSDLPKLFGFLSKVGVDKGLARLESLKHMFERNLKFKEFLKETHKSTINETNKKVLVVTHSAYSKMATTLEAYGMTEIKDFPNDAYKLDNCEMISMIIK